MGKSGLAHLFEHLFFTGTALLGRDGYVKAVQELGADCNAGTSTSSVKFHSTFTSELLDQIFKLETERFARTVEFLTESVLEREKAVVRRERIQRVEGSPYGDALEHLYQLLFGYTTYGRIPVGILADVESITLAECVEYFGQSCHGARLNIALCGKVDATHALELAARLADAFPPKPDNLASASAASVPLGGVRELAGPQPKLFIGYLLPSSESPSYDEARLASYLLGKGQRSWLNKQLVQDGSFIGHMQVRTLTRLGVPSVGVIEARPTAHSSIDDVRGYIHASLANLNESMVSIEDVQRACAYYQRSWSQDDDSTRGRAEGLSLAMLRAGRSSRYEEELLPATATGMDVMSRALPQWSSERIVGEVIYR